MTAWTPTRRTAALIEQGLLSGAHLVAFVCFARALSPAAWGAFGLAHATVLFVQGFQRAAVTIPMIPYSAEGAGWLHDRSDWLARNCALVLMVLVALALAVAGSVAAQAGWVTEAFTMALLLAAPTLVHEFARRAAVQEGRWRLLAAMGAVYAAALLAAVVALQGTPASTAWAPLLAMAVAATAASALYAAATRMPVLARPALRPLPAGYLAFGGWASLCHLGHAGYNFGVQAVLATWAGPAAVGVFHACRTLVQPVATLAGALDTVDKPCAAAALAAQGVHAMRRVLLRTAALALGLALPYLAFVAIAAEPLLQWLYVDRYAEQTPVVLLWCGVALCSLLAQPVESGLYVTRRTRTLFAIRAVAAAASLLSAGMLVPASGARGALAAMALGFALVAGLGAMTLRQANPRG